MLIDREPTLLLFERGVWVTSGEPKALVAHRDGGVECLAKRFFVWVARKAQEIKAAAKEGCKWEKKEGGRVEWREWGK